MCVCVGVSLLQNRLIWAVVTNVTLEVEDMVQFHKLAGGVNARAECLPSQTTSDSLWRDVYADTLG